MPQEEEEEKLSQVEEASLLIMDTNMLCLRVIMLFLFSGLWGCNTVSIL